MLFDDCTIFCTSQSRRKLFFWYAVNGLLTCSLRHLLDSIVWMLFPQGSFGVCWALRWVHITVCRTGVVAFCYVGWHLGRFEAWPSASVCTHMQGKTPGNNHSCAAVGAGAEWEILHREHICYAFLVHFSAFWDGHKSQHFRLAVRVADTTITTDGWS